MNNDYPSQVLDEEEQEIEDNAEFSTPLPPEERKKFEDAVTRIRENKRQQTEKMYRQPVCVS